jgi:spermidine synthase
MVCHGELARDRPATKNLTEFFLWMSVGGVVGGLFNGLVAPLVFNAIVEYHLALVLACLLLPSLGTDTDTGWGLYADLALVAIFIFTGLLLVFLGIIGGAQWEDPQWEALKEALGRWPLVVELVGLAAVLLGAWWMRRKWHRPWLDVGLLLVSALPVLTISSLLVGALPVYFQDLPDATDLSQARWGWPLAGLCILLAAGLAHALLARTKRWQCWLDLALPLALAVLVVGLVWGIYNSDKILWPRVVKVAELLHLHPRRQLFPILAYGLPAVFCYTFVERSFRFGLGVAALLLGSSINSLTDDSVIFQTRSFFGVLKVENSVEGPWLYHRLVHGTTMHGKQALDPELQKEPLTYYHRTGPIGQVMMAYNQDGKRNLAIIGLGTGTMAAYAREGQSITFYDIDPTVRDISFTTDKYFTYIADARARGAKVDLVLGDARLTMERKQLSEAEKYGIIVVDAFSSDAIPIHLITREALKVYLDKMTEDAILAFHVSNRYLELEPVLANLAEQADPPLACLQLKDNDESFYPGKASSTWVMLARKEAYLDRLKVPEGFAEERDKALKQLRPLMGLPDMGSGLSAQALMLYGVVEEWKVPGKWEKPATRPEVGVWTDDYSNLFSVFAW